MNSRLNRTRERLQSRSKVIYEVHYNFKADMTVHDEDNDSSDILFEVFNTLEYSP